MFLLDATIVNDYFQLFPTIAIVGANDDVLHKFSAHLNKTFYLVYT